MRETVRVTLRDEMADVRSLVQKPLAYLTREEVERFFRAIPTVNLRDRTLFDLIYRHGLRRGEAAQLTLHHTSALRSRRLGGNVMHWPKNTVCTCTHGKAQHWFATSSPKGPCRECACKAFMPEPVCECGHGKKAHPKGHCKQKYLDGGTCV
jgi:hypothetical protein